MKTKLLLLVALFYSLVSVAHYASRENSVTHFNFYENSIEEIGIKGQNSSNLNANSSSTRLYVDVDATGSNDGSSWANAFTTLQAALSVVNNDGEIWVAEGVYKPHSSNRDIVFNITKNNVKLYGGFSGSETQLSDRIIGANPTILSGDLQNNDVNITNYPTNYSNATRNSDNSYHIVNVVGENVLLAEFTISDAHNNKNATELGGAIVKHSNVEKFTLKNCIVKDNVSRNYNAGLLAWFDITGSRCELRVENCQFINNMSRWASGIYSLVENDTKADVTIENTLFENNVAQNLSSTVEGMGGSAAWFRNVGNIDSEIDVKFNNNTLVNNYDAGTRLNMSESNRACLAIDRINTSTGNSVAKVSNCIFWNNRTSTSVARSISDLIYMPFHDLKVINSIDQLGFNDSSITFRANISTAYPMFVDMSSRDFTLQMGSPAIDAGVNADVTTSTDLLGNARIHNGVVDMGVYEFGSSTTLDTDDLFTLKNTINLYPNPVFTTIYVESTIDVKELKIYDLTGKLVMQQFNNTALDVSRLHKGVYVMVINTTENTQHTKRFIKE